MTTDAPVAERRDGCMRQGPSGWPTLAARDAFGQRLQHRFGGPPGAIRVEPGAVGDPRQELRGRHGLDVRASGQQGRESLGSWATMLSYSSGAAWLNAVKAAA
jgi:hypothetical protein